MCAVDPCLSSNNTTAMMRSNTARRLLSCWLLIGLTAVTTHQNIFVSAGFGQNNNNPTKVNYWNPFSSWQQPPKVKPSSPGKTSSVNDEIRDMEQQVLASVREKRDFDVVARALREGEEASSTSASASSSKASSSPSALIPSKGAPPQPFYMTPDPATQQIQQVALASAIVTAVASFLLFSNIFITILLSTLVFWSANSDPLENDNDGFDENLLGAMARIVGRKTVQAYQQATPKVKAVARAVVTGQQEMALLKARIQELEEQEIQQLQQCVEVLEAENAALQQYKQTRELVDRHAHRYKLPELKQVARDYNLPVGGTKDQVLMRLVQAGVIDLEEE
jgi:hypothetical protein